MTTISSLQAVLFDLDGTLLDRDTTLARFLDQQYDLCRDLLAGIERDVFVQTVTKLDAHGYVPRPLVYTEVQKTFGLTVEARDVLLADFEGRFHMQAIPFPGMIELLRSLSEMSLGLALVTNGTVQSQQPKIMALGIAEYFGSILISEEQGVRKPEPEIYQRAMRALKATPSTSVFVGDHPEADIQGAARLGLRTIWKRNSCWPAPAQTDAIIDSLDEIVPILESWR